MTEPEDDQEKACTSCDQTTDGLYWCSVCGLPLCEDCFGWVDMCDQCAEMEDK